MAAALPFVIAGAGMAGSMFSAYNQEQAGKAQNSAYQQNAAMAESEAATIRESAKYDEQLQLEAAQRLRSHQRLLYSKAGVDITSGSPLLTMAFDAGIAERDMGTTRYNADVKATKARNQASMYRFYGEEAERAGTTAAYGTILAGIGNSGSSYMSASRGVGTQTRGVQ